MIIKTIDDLVGVLIEIHPEAEVQRLGELTFITLKLENEVHPQIIYTINKGKKELKLCIGSYVAQLALDEITLASMRGILFRHGTLAGLSPIYLSKIVK